jgi:hypothetical protein
MTDLDEKAYQILRSNFRGRTRNASVAVLIQSQLGVSVEESEALARRAYRRFYTVEGGLPDVLGPEPEQVRDDDATAA